jgi:membrane-associated phospholipid phosphatase
MAPRGGTARLSGVDRLFLGCLAGLFVLAALRHPSPAPLLAACAGLAALIVASASASAGRSREVRVFHDFLPIGLVFATFNLAGPVIAAANPARWDTFFAAADARYLPTLAAAWRAALGRPAWLTDLASICYFSYYFVPVAIAVALYATGRRADFARFVLVVVATFAATWIGYLAFPTTGPRVAAGEADSVLGGSALSRVLRMVLAGGEMNLLDAFPSGHTAVAVVFCALGCRLFPRWRWRVFLVLDAAGIVFATVYLSLHYVVDIAAGFALAGLVGLVAGPLARAFGVPHFSVPQPPPPVAS